MQSVPVRISNPVSGFSRTATTDAAGRYVFSNVPPNSYHLTVEAQGFQTLERDVDVRTGVPITVDLTLALAGATEAVAVVGHAGDLLGADNLLHTDRTKLRVRFSVINLTNRDALYNFLSTFSGTHFVTPRAYQLQVGVTF